MASPLKGNTENIERKIQGVTNTQDSIQSLSLWAIHHKSDAKQIVDVWLKVLKKAHTKQRLTLFNLCNDIVQNGRRKKANEFSEMYKEVLKDAVVLVRDESISKNIKRILTIWKDRKVFPKDFLAEITELHETKESSPHTPPANHSSSSTPTPSVPHHHHHVHHHPKPVRTLADIDPQVIADFKPQTLIDKINNYKRFEAEVELKRKQLSNMKLDASSTEAIKQLKDKAHGNQFSKQFEESCSKLEDYVSSANKDIIEKGALIELLETSQLFYEEQYKEAKIVANAYKNFGTRINNLRKRLEDLVKSLPSPVPSPSRDAPSPGNTPPEDTLDNTESVDMDLDDEGSSLISKPTVETSAVVVEDADESYDPAAAPYLPTQPQFSASGPFNADPVTLQNIEAVLPTLQSAAQNQGSMYNGQDPRKLTPTGAEIPVYNPPPKSNAIQILSKQASNEEGEGTPVKDEGSATPVMDEKQDSPPPPKHQNPIDFLTQILANTAKTTASGSNFLASLSLLTNTVKTQFQQKKEDTTTMNSRPIMSEQSANSWAEWKAANTSPQTMPPQAVPPQNVPMPVPSIIPPPVFPQMMQPPISQSGPLSHAPTPMSSMPQLPASSAIPVSPPVLSSAPVGQQPYAPVSAPFTPRMNITPPRPPEPWRPPNLAPLQQPPFPGFMGQPPVRLGGGDQTSPPWGPLHHNSQPKGPPHVPSTQPQENSPWADFHSQPRSLQSPPAQMVSPSVQPKSILRNRSFSTSLREVPLVQNDNMAINPEPPSDPPSPMDGRHKMGRQGSDPGGQVADDHREFLEKLKRKTAGGPNLVSPPVIDNDGHKRFFATNRARPNLTTITPVDLNEHEMDENHKGESENGAQIHTNNESLNAISNYTEQGEEEFVQNDEMEEEIDEEKSYQEELREFEQSQKEEQNYDDQSYAPPSDFNNPFHRHPRPPLRHNEPFFHPRFPPRFEAPYRRDPNFTGFRDPYGGPPSKRPYHDNYRPYRRPYNRY